MNSLFQIIGSPFVGKGIGHFTDDQLLAAYDQAFPNRVALLYLTLHRRPGWDPRLEQKYISLKQRETMTFEVISKLAETVNSWDANGYVIFKSIKPYPATPNDTDLICMSDKVGYERMYKHLLDSGYIFHEWAPQQRTVYDPRGVGKIGKGKKGGTYYIDLYCEISTDYFSYMTKSRLKPFIVTRMLNGIPVKLLGPEPELAIVLFHSVFPERTFQLEHFYYPLYALADPAFDMSAFLRFSIESGCAFAVKTQATLIAHLHQQHFGCVPSPIETILKQLGKNHAERRRFAATGNLTPYLFSPRTFWTTFAYKSLEWYSFRSLMVQAAKMCNPRFFMDVMKSIRRRLSEKGAYHLE